MAFRLIKTPTEIEPLVANISELADRNRDAFGFLPEGAYAAAAARGRLWAFVDESNEVCAHLMFGGRSSRISVQQLFVKAESRRSRLGWQLIEELKNYASSNGCQTISARVAADLPSNEFWEKAGLVVLRQLKGGKVKDRLINERVYEIRKNFLWGASDEIASTQTEAFLFANPQLIDVNYALDLNVFFDVIRKRLESDTARSLMSAAMANEISLCVTSEFSVELERNAQDLSKDPVLDLARTLPTLPVVSNEILGPKIEELRKIIFPDVGRSPKRVPNDTSDLIHLATCIHHKTSGFITREKAILRVAETLKRRFQLDVLSVEDALLSVSEPSAEIPRIAVWLDEADFRVEQLKEKDRASIEKFLQEKIKLDSDTIRFSLDPGTSSSPRRRLAAFSDDKVVGFASWTQDSRSSVGITSYLFVDDQSTGAQHFLDHSLQKLSFEGPERTFLSLRLVTIPENRLVINTALARGFNSSDDGLPSGLHGLCRQLFRGVVTTLNWEDFRQKFAQSYGLQLPERLPKFTEGSHTGIVLSRRGIALKPIKLFEFERNFSPLLILASGRPGTIVPIQDTYAKWLLNIDQAQMPLLPEKEAPLRIERAYFSKKAGFEKMFEREGIVVFYASGKGGKLAIGAARITYSGKVPIAKARLEYSRLGVLEDRQYDEMADAKGEVRLFTFDGFIRFSSPVTYQQLKNMGCVEGNNLVSAQQLKFDGLSKIIEAGTK